MATRAELTGNVSAMERNFVSMADTLHHVDDDTDGANSELWLVQVPQGFDVTALDKLDTGVLDLTGGTYTLKVKDEQNKKVRYAVSAFRESTECKKMCTVGTDSSSKASLGQPIHNMLVVTESATDSAWHADSALLAPKKPVPMPSGLRERYTPFGAGTPIPSVSKTTKKSKKKKKRASEVSVDEVDSRQPVEKSSRKRKREKSSNLSDEVSSPRKKKSRDSDMSDEAFSPRKKKSKNSDVSDEASPPKKQKSKNLSMSEEISPPRKKKSKKDKHRRTM